MRRVIIGKMYVKWLRRLGMVWRSTIRLSSIVRLVRPELIALRGFLSTTKHSCRVRDSKPAPIEQETLKALITQPKVAEKCLFSFDDFGKYKISQVKKKNYWKKNMHHYF